MLLAGFAVALGATPDAITNPFGGTIDTGGAVGIAFAVVWILGMINSINFIDGLDGLSSGIGLIAAATLGLISLTTAVGGRSDSHSSPSCASPSPERSSGSSGGTSTRPRSSPARAA